MGGIVCFYAWLVYAATRIDLPCPDHPVLFYSNQTRQDIRLTFEQALKAAKRSIFLSVYGISDPQILQLLAQKSCDNVSVLVEYDPSASKNLIRLLPAPAVVCPLKTKGLMHKKIVVIDNALVFLGSANLTASSLRHHANLVLGLYHPGLAAWLEHPEGHSFLCPFQGQTGEIFLLPDPQNAGREHLMHAILSAKKTIRIAMFTLTHPDLVEALIQAHQRGVDVRVAVDHYTARGASKKALLRMEKEGMKTLLGQGRELLHHKWAVIDGKTLVMGSANWTKAAFSKNSDFLFFLSPLREQQIRFLMGLWEVIEADSSFETKSAA